MFQHTAARRRLAAYTRAQAINEAFQHTAARRRLGPDPLIKTTARGFNTQPPEGGWIFQKK